jgi:hypothetical protein
MTQRSRGHRLAVPDGAVLHGGRALAACALAERPGRFAKDRVVRLGVLVVYVLVVWR